MIQLGTLAPNDEATVQRTAGGFAWRYLDLVNEHGDGLVLIWALGLPFLPEIAAHAQRDRLARPDAHPSLNIAVYKGGVQAHYLLQTVSPTDCDWQPDRGYWRIGATEIRAHRNPDKRLYIRATIDCPTPGSPERLTGEIAAQGVGAQLSDVRVPLTSSAHAWAPTLTCAQGTARLTVGDQPLLHMTGRVYYDGNASPQPLHRLGFARWWWARLAFPDHELLLYHLHPNDPAAPPRHIAVRVTPDGACAELSDAQITPVRTRANVWGARAPHVLNVTGTDTDVQVTVHQTWETGPFYQRFRVIAQTPHAQAYGVAEVVHPERIHRPWRRPLIEMRVHRLNAPNSMWLPLFGGPRDTRLRRLFSQFRSAA